MELNKIEFLVFNNPLRRLVQKHIEFKTMQDLMKLHRFNIRNKNLLDVGCGCGYSTELLCRHLNPVSIAAFDLMPEHVKKTRKRCRGNNIETHVFVGDVTQIGVPDNSIDAAFVFGVLHHVSQWQQGLREICRVLRPGGLLLIEEVNEFGVYICDMLHFYHPMESRFSWCEFAQGLDESGFQIIDEKSITVFLRCYACKKR